MPSDLPLIAAEYTHEILHTGPCGVTQRVMHDRDPPDYPRDDKSAVIELLWSSAARTRSKPFPGSWED